MAHHGKVGTRRGLQVIDGGDIGRDPLECETWCASDQEVLRCLLAQIDEAVTELSDACGWKWALLGIRRHVAATVSEPQEQAVLRSAPA